MILAVDRLGCVGRSVLHPLWPPPERTDSHAAPVFPRPFHSVMKLTAKDLPQHAQQYAQCAHGSLQSSARTRAHHKPHSVRAHARRYGSAGSNMPRGGWPVPRNVEEYLTKIFG